MMEETLGRTMLGPFVFERELGPCPLGRRWLAEHVREQSMHVLYEITTCRDRTDQRRFIEHAPTVCELRHPHILPVQRLSITDDEPWLVTPYTGNQEGLVTLGALLAAKGTMSPQEAGRAVTQLLQALQYAHERNVYNGPVGLEQVLVDRHGCAFIELYGMGRMLEGLRRGNAELAADEVRSVVEIGYQLVTGQPAEEPRIEATRLVRKLDRRWDEWFENGLDPLGGYRNASEALSEFPTVREEDASRVPAVRVVLGRVRSALRQP